MKPKHQTPTGHWLPRAASTKSTMPWRAGPSVFLLVATLGLAACSRFLPSLPAAQVVDPKPRTPTMEYFVKTFADLPGWVADNHAESLPAFVRSCDKIEQLPKDQKMGNLREMGAVSDWLPLCQAARIIRPGNKVEAQYFYETKFTPYLVRNREVAKGLFTGYYEPDLRGAFGPDNRYRFPIYAKPNDLIGSDLGQFDHRFKGRTVGGRIVDGKYIPYFTRAEIEDGALSGRQLETVWVDSATDAFVLHIQGSGRIILPDGSHVRVGYAGRNGHRYTAIGRELVAAGELRLEDVTMPAILEWIDRNPIAAVALMRKNKSFIFFQIVDGAGPIGAQGVPLTPGRSLAVDRAFFPMGIPFWLDITEPGTFGAGLLRRLVIAQDTGSAIKGPVRGDFFWGHGREAARKAGLMKDPGEFYMLLPRTAARPVVIN